MIIGNKRSDNPLFAISLYILSLLLMVLLSSLVKTLHTRYPMGQILLFRYLFTVIPIIIIAFATQGVAVLKTTRVGDHVIRSISGILGLGLFFYAIALIPLAEATTLAYSSAIFITILSIPFLGEKIGLIRWLAVGVGFVGVMVIAQPGSAIFSVGGVVAILSAISAAFVFIWLRKMSDTESVATSSIYYNGLGTCLFVFWVAVQGWQNIIDPLDWVLLIALGLTASVQQIIFAVSFRYGEASLLAPFSYLILVFSVFAGYLFWHEVPALSSIIGGMVIMGSGLIILTRTQSGQVEKTA